MQMVRLQCRVLTFSEDGSLAAYQISEGGSDWRKVIIINTETKEQLQSALIDVKFSGLSWVGNDGFYYSAMISLKAVNSLQRLININCFTIS